MTISCTCPKCDQVCGFKDDYAGRRARCLACGTRFTIPLQSSVATEPVPDEPEGPLPGFYGAVFRHTPSAFVQRESLGGVIFCIALTGFHFFLGDRDYSFSLPGFRMPLFVGWIVTFVTAGYLLWYFIETIRETADGCDFLPDIAIGGGFAFVGQAAKSIYIFVVAFAVPLIPAALLLLLLAELGLDTPWLQIPITAACLLAAPLVLAILACEAPPWMLLRIDRLAVIIVRTAGPYLLTAAVTLTAFLLVFVTLGYFAAAPGNTPHPVLMLTARIAAVFVTLAAMRTIGLYARHYFTQFGELNPPEY